MNKTEYIKNLKENASISKYEKSLIDKFFQNSKVKILLKKPEYKVSFGKTFELFVSWIFADMKNNFYDYVVKIETNNKKNMANDGVDIIYPNNDKKKIYFIQVKTGKNQFQDTHKLQKRGHQFLMELQNSNISSFYISNKWKISEKIVKNMKLKKDDWEIHLIWLTEKGPSKNKKNNNSNISYWGIYQILLDKAPSNPESMEVNHKYEFIINSTFSTTDKKSIIKYKNKKINSLVIPVQIKKYYDFLKSIPSKERGDVGIENLFPGNVRYYQGNTKIANSIKNSIINPHKNSDPENFHIYNNGITAIAKMITLDSDNTVNGNNDKFIIRGFNVVNGQQTTMAIWNALSSLESETYEKISNEAFILIKILVIPQTDKKKDSKLRKISEATNTQKLIKASELMSTLEFNKILHDSLLKKGIFYKYKTGDNSFTKYFKKWPKVELSNLLKYWYIMETKNVWAKNQLNSFMEALLSLNAVSKTMQERYEVVSKKFNSLSNDKLEELFKKIANVYVEIKDLKRKKNKTIQIKQSIDMFSYFMMVNYDVAMSKSFINKFNDIINTFSSKYMENDESKNIANAFKTEKETKDLFLDIEQDFINMIK